MGFVHIIISTLLVSLVKTFSLLKYLPEVDVNFFNLNGTLCIMAFFDSTINLVITAF